MYDCIIIGSGPSGISAALYLHRFGYRILVIGKQSDSLSKAHLIENYYGVGRISGVELQAKGIKQARELGIEVIEEEVLAIDPFNDNRVTTKNNVYNAKNIILAIGRNKVKHPRLNASHYEGKGVSYCVLCDGFFYSGKKLGIIGSGEYMEHELQLLRQFSEDITIFTDGELYEKRGKENVVSGKIIKLIGDDELTGIETENDTITLDGVFIASGSPGGLEFAKTIGIALKGNEILIDSNYQTNVADIYAIGDCIGGHNQIAKGVADGLAVAMILNKKMRSKE